MHAHQSFHPPLRNPSWGEPRCCWAGAQRCCSFWGWKAARCSGPQTSGIDEGMGGSLLLFLLHGLHKYFLLIILFAVFRFSLWMQLMLYLDVKGITILVKILDTWGDFLGLFLPWSKHIEWRREVYFFFPRCPGVHLLGVTFKHQREHSFKHVMCFNVVWERWSSLSVVMGESTLLFKIDEGATKAKPTEAHHVGCTHFQSTSAAEPCPCSHLSQGGRSLLGRVISRGLLTVSLLTYYSLWGLSVSVWGQVWGSKSGFLRETDLVVWTVSPFEEVLWREEVLTENQGPKGCSLCPW